MINLPPTASQSWLQSGKIFSLSVLRGIAMGTDVSIDALALSKSCMSSGDQTILSREFFPPTIFSNFCRTTEWLGIVLAICLNAPSQPLIFFTVDGGSAKDKGESTWSVGDHLSPCFFQPKMTVVTGQITIFDGLNVKLAFLALSRTVLKFTINSVRLFPRTYIWSAILVHFFSLTKSPYIRASISEPHSALFLKPWGETVYTLNPPKGWHTASFSES